MEKHINKFSSRILSLYSKTILINTLILSKTSYLINVFSLDAEIVLKTHSKIFKYLRNNKRTEPISRKKSFLKNQTPTHFKSEKRTSSWKNLATCWLAIDNHNYSKKYNFLMDNNRTKILNGKKSLFYYNDIMNYIENRNINIPKTKPETKIIYQTNNPGRN